MTVGDGGMLTTRNPEFDALFRLLRQHGMWVPDTVRHGSATVIFEDYPVQGFNYRMTDMQAAIGREQLKRLAGIVARRRALADRFSAALLATPGAAAPAEPDWARSNWQSYPVRLDASLDQRAVMHAHARRRGSRPAAASCAPIWSRPTPTPRCGTTCVGPARRGTPSSCFRSSRR